MVEVYDGRLGELRDSLQNEEYMRYVTETDTSDDYNVEVTEEIKGDPQPEPASEPEEEPEEPVFIQ